MDNNFFFASLTFLLALLKSIQGNRYTGRNIILKKMVTVVKISTHYFNDVCLHSFWNGIIFNWISSYSFLLQLCIQSRIYSLIQILQHGNYHLMLLIQANSENCGPPLGNNFDLEEGQRSRSRHGVTWKGLSQGSCMPNINALPLILQKIWARLKFLWQTDGGTGRGTDRQTDEWALMSPRFRESGGQ